METNNFDSETLTYMLPLYYKRLFPYHPYCRWLSYGNKKLMECREISFTLSGDIYVRFQSFCDRNELIEAFQQKNPIKIDIGAVYNVRPRDRNMVQIFWPIQREIVFDIDLTDYDEVRTCCSEAGICTKCWKLMAVACKILDVALRDDFGFEHILWVFSGRRGVHCWVCDDSARELDGEQRSAIADYLNHVKGGAGKAKKVNFRRDQLHHSVLRALEIIENYFEDICLVDQDILGTEERVANFIKLIPETDDRDSFKTEILKETSTKDRWDAFVNHWNRLKGSGKFKTQMRHLIEEIKMHYIYPRIDINVTKGMNHLLKSPFCVHPKTGKISIPFNLKVVDKFNPCTVPTISALVDEINAYDVKTQQEDAMDGDHCVTGILIKDYKKTSAYKYILVFEEFVRKLENERKGKMIETSDLTMEF